MNGKESDGGTKTIEQTMAEYGLPTSFGKKDESFDTDSQINKTLKQKQLQQYIDEFEQLRNESSYDEDTNKENLKNDAVDDSSQLENEKVSEYLDKLTLGRTLPITNEVRLNRHQKRISSLSLDPAGARLLTGGFDSMLKMWDFAAMDSSFRSFRELEAEEGYPINSVSYNTTGGFFLVGTNSWEPKIYGRDGHQIAQCVKGDMYLVDMSSTRGHVASVTHALFSPTETNIFLTSSNDGTIRIWDSDNCARTHKTVVKVFGQGRGKGPVTTCAFDSSGTLIAGNSYSDGALQIFPINGPFLRPSIHIQKAHLPKTNVASICFVKEKNTLVSRALDDTVKLWDLRNTKTPLGVRSDITTVYDESQVIADPSSSFVVLGSSGTKDNDSGMLYFLDSDNLSTKQQLKYEDANVVSLLWHKKINQIVLGMSDGSARVLFDPTRSENGALLGLSRQAFKGVEKLYEAPIVIINPDTLPNLKERQEQQQRDRADPRKTHTPAVPSGPGTLGRPGTTLTQLLVQQIGFAPKLRADDPVEALTKLEKVASSNPKYVGTAYKETQPVKIFLDTESESDEDNEENPQKKRKTDSGRL